jgi:hypothetical protein
MESERRSGTAAVGTFFTVLERLILFALALAVGLVNFLIGLAVAAHLGIIPKGPADRVIHVTTEATAFLTRIMGSPRPGPKHKAKP